MALSPWKQRVEAEREQKDWFFATHPQSPLPARERRNLRGLTYSRPDLAYRFELDLLGHRTKEPVEISDTA